jgi:hypothetical protein
MLTFSLSLYLFKFFSAPLMSASFSSIMSDGIPRHYWIYLDFEFVVASSGLAALNVFFRCFVDLYPRLTCTKYGELCVLILLLLLPTSCSVAFLGSYSKYGVIVLRHCCWRGNARRRLESRRFASFSYVFPSGFRDLTWACFFVFWTHCGMRRCVVWRRFSDVV